MKLMLYGMKITFRILRLCTSFHWFYKRFWNKIQIRISLTKSQSSVEPTKNLRVSYYKFYLYKNLKIYTNYPNKNLKI